MNKSMTEIGPQPARKEWRQPELRRLAIAATANCTNNGMGKTVVSGNEGVSGGKGDCGVVS